jgi:poly(hydroxyalkanoate) granule-associated protein
MANKKAPRNTKKHATHAPVAAGSIWMAGVGAVSLARKQAKALLGDMVSEGNRMQAEATKFVRQTRAGTRARIKGLLTPVRAQLQSGTELVKAAVESGLAGMRARLGIPSKADIDELSQRVGALSRQLKAASK